MHQEALKAAVAPDKLSKAFEHSITWEDDIWRADPVDVEEVHKKARIKFFDLLNAITDTSAARRRSSADTQARILLFHGQSGAGKTHLIRALRTGAHRTGKAYLGYAQMSPDIANYADYYLRRLIASLERPYDPDNGGESALARLTAKLIDGAGEVSPEYIEKLREATLDDRSLALLVHELADSIVAAPQFADENIDINIIRALLYLERNDPRIEQRVRQYLQCRPLNELSLQSVAALDPNVGEGRAFDIIEGLGRLMWAVDGAALVFSIDQVEDLRFFDDSEERFQKAVRDLIQIANRVPTAIIVISCLDDFYAQVREPLAQSYRDRIEKSGPVALYESRTAEEARQIIARRLAHEAEQTTDAVVYADPSAYFGPEFFEEFSGLSTRRLLEHAQNRLRVQTTPGEDDADLDGGECIPERPAFVSTLAAALGFGKQEPRKPAPIPLIEVDYREMWERFHNSSEAEIPSDDNELMDVLGAALNIAATEWDGMVDVTTKRLEIADDLPTMDIAIRQRNGLDAEARVFLCNRKIPGGVFKRQLDTALASMGGKTCFILRASDYPLNAKSQAAQSLRKFREGGGRALLVPMAEWERMMTVREFHAHHRNDPGFSDWFGDAKLLSNLIVIIQLLRLDLLGRMLPPRVINGGAEARPQGAHQQNIQDSAPSAIGAAAGAWTSREATASGYASAFDGGGALDANVSDFYSSMWSQASAANPGGDDELPLSVILDENGIASGSIFAGRELIGRRRPVTLNPSVMKRHAAVLGGSGSGKTTLALSLIEQLLQRGIPAILIDRKGDLCSYANPEVWRADDDEHAERRAQREKLADAIDVAVYTPGRASGRPISITLLPNGINELPEHEQQLLANLSAAALGDMLHLKNSATHQKQSGTLSVALRILGSRYSREVTLADLINLLEDEDPELSDLTQRMDPSGKLRRDLVAQLDSLRHRNAALFEGGGETMSMERFLGLGPHAREGRTRLSIIYTGFLGDNENILFWVSQFLSEALRFCQRNPNDELQAVVMFDEADLYIPANAKPATAEPLQSLLKRARSAGLGLMLATQSPGDLDYKSRDQITSWFIGRVREDTALRKLKAAFQSESGLDPAAVLPHQTVGEFHLVQEGLVRAMKAQRSLVLADQVPFDRIEQLAAETRGQDQKQLGLFDKG
ncbi:MAG: helicase HerA-like domain-containing protein [Hyphomicrobiaceae bacterium]